MWCRNQCALIRAPLVSTSHLKEWPTNIDSSAADIGANCCSRSRVSVKNYLLKSVFESQLPLLGKKIYSMWCLILTENTVAHTILEASYCRKPWLNTKFLQRENPRLKPSALDSKIKQKKAPGEELIYNKTIWMLQNQAKRYLVRIHNTILL